MRHLNGFVVAGHICMSMCVLYIQGPLVVCGKANHRVYHICRKPLHTIILYLNLRPDRPDHHRQLPTIGSVCLAGAYDVHRAFLVNGFIVSKML